MKSATEPGWVIILEYRTDGPETQRALIDGLAGMIDDWVSPYEGLMSARFHASVSGTKVINNVWWETEDHYRKFLEDSDNEGRVAALNQLFERLDGKVEFLGAMDEVPGYRILRTVAPGAR